MAEPRREWISTSVDDLRSTLDHYAANRCLMRDLLPVMRATAVEAERIGHRTRAKLLLSHVRRAERSIQNPDCRRHDSEIPNGAKRP